MTFFFVGSILAQSIAGRASFNHDQLAQNEDPLSWSATSPPKTSGTGRCRIGNQNFLRWPLWRRSPSIYGSGDHRNPNGSEHPTTRLLMTADRP
jgi:hypothetical protein